MRNKLIIFFLLIFTSKVNAQFSPLGQGFDNPVRCIFGDSVTGLVYAGGNFAFSGTTQINNVARWDGINWDSLGPGGPGVGQNVHSITRYQDTIYIAGTFNSMGGLIGSAGLDKWDGNNWHTAGNITGGGDGNVSSIKEINNLLYVVGGFDTVNGIAAKKIAKWDGVNWSFFPVLDNVSPGWPIISIANYNSDLYVGGNFDSQIASNMKDIAMWNGNAWGPVLNGLSGWITAVDAMIVFQGELYVGGYFNIATGDPGNFIMKWNGTSWSQLGSGLNGTVFTMAEFNNELYVGGPFTQADGIPVNSIAKWDGTQWHSIPNANFDNAVTCLEVFNNELYIGGAFYNVNGITVNHICKYTPSVGFAENEKSKLKVYPNPCNNELHFYFNKDEKAELKIQDITGKIIYYTNTIINNSINTINLSHISSGIYFVQLKTKDETLNKKIVVQH